jgi:cyclase
MSFASGRTDRVIPPVQLREVAERIFAYLQLDGGWCLNNAGVLVGRDAVVVIDTAATEARARRLRELIESIAPGLPRFVVNTHHHGDHIFGNAVVAPDAMVIGHELARSEAIDAGLGLQRLWPDVDWGEITLMPPSVTFSDRITIHLDDRRVELIHVGPAHTTNDVVVWLPAERVLFAGDVVLSGCTPFCLMGSLEGSLRAVERLRLLEPETIVCGHGDVSGPEVFDETVAYLRWVRQLAVDGAAADLTPLQVARECDMTRFANLLDPERIVGNLHRAYAERGGAPLGVAVDVVNIFREMIRFNAGRLPICLA